MTAGPRRAANKRENRIPRSAISSMIAVPTSQAMTQVNPRLERMSSSTGNISLPAAWMTPAPNSTTRAATSQSRVRPGDDRTAPQRGRRATPAIKTTAPARPEAQGTEEAPTSSNLTSRLTSIPMRATLNPTPHSTPRATASDGGPCFVDAPTSAPQWAQTFSTPESRGFPQAVQKPRSDPRYISARPPLALELTKAKPSLDGPTQHDDEYHFENDPVVDRRGIQDRIDEPQKAQ